MKRWSLFVIFTSCVCLATTAFAGKNRTVELQDGTVLQAEIVSVQDEVYTLKTEHLGTIQVKAEDIRNIQFSEHDTTASPEKPTKPAAVKASPAATKSVTPSATANASENANHKETVQTLQASMMEDQDIFNLILSLQEDPAMQAVLSDPELMNAINSLDISALMSNQKFQKLFQHPTVRAIIEKEQKQPKIKIE